VSDDQTVVYWSMMQRDEELQLGDHLKALIEQGPVPASTPATDIDTEVYRSVECHRAELSALAASPAAAALSSDVAEPGDFVTLELGGVPVIVARDRDGIVRAMVNSCAHRGATVERRPAGSARVFSCAFHGWSYDIDGALRAVADAALFSSEGCDRGLRALGCEERHGIVWVTANPDVKTKAVAEWLGHELDCLMSDLGLGEMVGHASTEYDLACNWKLLTDGFLEIYHLKYLHRNSIAPYFPANLMRFDRTGDHFLGWLPKNRLVTQLTERPRADWRVLDQLTGAMVLVPGTVVQWQAGHVELFSLRPDPTHPGRSRVRLMMMVPKQRVAETDLWDRNWERVCVTIPDEDFAAAVDVQRNIDAGAAASIQIGANERRLVDHLDAVRKLCG
jgi:phenylpropionate dioxygenase-like ring-hydroxylating dioxygenase large terminal subunit